MQTHKIRGEDHYQCRELKAERDALRNMLNDLIFGDVGQQVLAKLGTGQGVDTDDGKAWLRAAAAVMPNDAANRVAATPK